MNGIKEPRDNRVKAIARRVSARATVLRLGRLLGAAIVAASLCLSLAAVPVASAATQLGGTSLIGACKAFWWDVPGTARVYTYAPHDAGTWVCTWKSQLDGRWVTTGFDMNRVCRWQYGAGAYARALDWSNKYSWRCFR